MTESALLVSPESVSLACFDVIILAAGSSRRFPHGNKLTMRYRGALLITKILNTVAKLDFGKRIIVTGPPYRDEISDILRTHAGWQECFNADAAHGMASSIALGAAAIQGPAGVFICPADMPGITPRDFRLLASQLSGPDSICRPMFANIPGHPVLFGSAYFPLLRVLTGNAGASSLVRQFQSRLIVSQSDNRGVILDVDTPDDFAAQEAL